MEKQELSQTIVTRSARGADIRSARDAKTVWDPGTGRASTVGSRAGYKQSSAYIAAIPTSAVSGKEHFAPQFD